MTARIIAIADDVVTVINGGSPFTIGAVTAERHYAPEYTLEELATLRVSVLPMEKPETLTSRSTTQRDFTISVGVQKKTENTAAGFDALVELVEEINDLFRFAKLPATGVSWVASEVDPVYDADDARTMSIFTSVLNLTFRDFFKKD